MVKSSPERRRQAERRELAERRILIAAAELISEMGPNRMTLSDIGERAGYSRSLTTHHFGSKRALLSRITETVTTAYHQDLEQIQHDSAIEGVRAVVDTYLTELQSWDPLVQARIALWANAAASGSSEDRDEALQSDLRFRQEISRRLHTGVDSGEIPSTLDVEGFVIILVGLLRGVALQLFLNPELSIESARSEADALISARLSI